MSLKARATFIFTLSLCQVRLCFPTGQPTNVLDKPAEVISTWTVGDDSTDGLQQTATEGIFDWLNMDALDHLIEWHDTEPLQVPSHQAHHPGQEREPLLPIVPPFEESGFVGPVDSSEGMDNYAQSEQHMNHIKDQAVSTKREDMEWQDTLLHSLKCVPMRYSKNPFSEEYISRLKCEYENHPHSGTRSFKNERIGFGNLPVQVVKSLGLVRPANEKSNAPIRKQRFLDHMKQLINWIQFISTLPMRKYGTRKDDNTISTEVIDWLITEIFNPSDSLPVLGIARKPTYPMDENFLKDDCISTCLSILKLFPNRSHHNLDFIYNMPEPEQGYKFTTKDQRMMKAIHSFKLQRRILYGMYRNTKASGLEGKRKAQNPIDVNQKSKVNKQ
ncbi:hypothetical protein H4Q26_007907 [Puccinia striiformis f. sp. tritici PST-130]|nr:hypothetical protein H4Q26_007907 [Puccinia striiformis f. sp. tritici PST-130]